MHTSSQLAQVSVCLCEKLCVLRDKIERHSIMHKSHEP